MTGAATETATAIAPVTGSSLRASRRAVIALTVAYVVALNLLIYLAGRAFGGGFMYTQAGRPNRVDVVAVALLSAIPLGIGLTFIAWLSRRWPALITTARVVAPVLAVATIWVMTIPAHFDTTSALCLATMHLALIPASLFALGALARRP